MTTEPRASLVEVDLLPCPFCGGEALHPVIYGTEQPQIWCMNCNVEMHPGKDGIPSAEEQWNTRHRLEALRTQKDGEGRGQVRHVARALRSALERECGCVIKWSAADALAEAALKAMEPSNG